VAEFKSDSVLEENLVAQKCRVFTPIYLYFYFEKLFSLFAYVPSAVAYIRVNKIVAHEMKQVLRRITINR
jgi:hypothetical protein